MKSSLRKAGQDHKNDLVSIGVDTWGLDFALLDQNENIIGDPFCYRDPQTEGMMERAFKSVSRQEIFQTTGLQFMKINTLFHLMAMVASSSPALEIAKTFLMIPDLINFWLTGRAACEYTNTSNTQLLDVRKKQWAYAMIEALGIPTHIFGQIVRPGQIFAPVQKSVLQDTGLSKIPVIATATADTACAVPRFPLKTRTTFTLVPAHGDCWAQRSLSRY